MDRLIRCKGYLCSFYLCPNTFLFTEYPYPLKIKIFHTYIITILNNSIFKRSFILKDASQHNVIFETITVIYYPSSAYIILLFLIIFLIYDQVLYHSHPIIILSYPPLFHCYIVFLAEHWDQIYLQYSMYFSICFQTFQSLLLE